MTIPHVERFTGRPIVRARRALSRRLLSEPIWVSLLMLTVLTLSRVHQHIGVIGRVRPALILFLLVVVAAVLQPRHVTWGNLTRFWPARVIIGLAILACVSAPFGLSLGSSARFILENYSKTLVYALLLIVALWGWQHVSRLVWAYVIGVGILTLLAIFVIGISKTSSGATYDANDVGLIVVVGLPLVLVTLQTSGALGKVLSVLILVLSAITIAKTQSRGAFLGLLVVGLGVLITLKSVSVARRIAVLGIAAVALALAAPKGYWEVMNTLRDPTSDYNWDSPNGRREIAKRGVGYMLQYPVLGIGIHNFSRAEGTISSKAREHVPGTGLRFAAAHNSFVEVGAELGVLGLLLWGSLVFGGMFTIHRMHRKLPSDWRVGDPEQRFLYSLTAALPIALAGFAVTSFFVSFSYQDPIYILSALVCGVYLTLPRRLAAVQHSRPVSRGRRRKVAPGVASAGQIAVQRGRPH